MTASGDPAAWTRLAMSAGPRSCEPLCECPPPDMEEIAESIEDVRGLPRAISALWDGGIVFAGGRELFDELVVGLRIVTESETLREPLVVSLKGSPFLLCAVSK
jgi:hypothetical protein